MHQNRTCQFFANEVELSFPRYDYEFYNHIDPIVNSIKWLKSLYSNKKPSAFDPDSKLPCWADLQFKVKTARVWLGDDNFENKIRNNILLHRDEAIQKEKRLFLVEKRLKSINLFDRDFEYYSRELLKKLEIADKNQLFKRLNLLHSSDKNVNLLTITGHNINLIALADSSLNSVEKCMLHLTEIDNDSPAPAKGASFLTMWFRGTHLTADSLRIDLKDYELPFLNFQKLTAFGRFGMAEQEGSKSSKRYEKVTFGKNADEFYTVGRNMIQLKTYYDMTINAENTSIAFCQSFDPVFTNFGQALDLITVPSIDPSPVIPFWDKIRLMMHGTLRINSNLLEYHTPTNPYNPFQIEERIVFQGDNVELAWENALFKLSGDLKIIAKSVHEEDSVVAHFPEFSMDYKINYEMAEGDNPNDHHSIIPVNPEHVGHWKDLRNIFINETFVVYVRDKVNKAQSRLHLSLDWMENVHSI